jgi:hypothetical protein
MTKVLFYFLSVRSCRGMIFAYCSISSLFYVFKGFTPVLTEGFTGAGYAAGHRQLGPEASLALNIENLSTNQETTTFIKRTVVQ